jgi:TatD DNase family protein
VSGQLFVDTHCHLDRYQDPTRVLSESGKQRVVVVAVTETPSDFQHQLTRIGDDKFLRPALGLHPLRAARMSGSEVERFFASLGQTDYIGEIGIDRSRQGKPTEARQIQLFERVLAEPRIKQKVLTIHSRGAAKEVVERMEQTSVVGILHWYTGSLTIAERALAAGLYFSVNPSMVRSKAGQRLLQLLPKDRVLTETDGPYCRVGSRESLPTDIPLVIDGLTGIWGISKNETAEAVIENLARLHSQTVG